MGRGRKVFIWRCVLYRKSLISNFEIGKSIIKNLFLDKKYIAKLKFFIFRVKYKLKI